MPKKQNQKNQEEKQQEKEEVVSTYRCCCGFTSNKVIIDCPKCKYFRERSRYFNEMAGNVEEEEEDASS